MYKYIIPFSIICVFFACNEKKHITTDKNPNNNWWMDSKTPVDPNLNSESRPDYNPSFERVSDLLHTKLEVRFDYAKRYMYGKATITARPYFYSNSTLELDARGMQINRVALLARGATNSSIYLADTTKLSYDYDGQKLKIKLGREYSRTENYTVFIDYISKPDEQEVGGSAAISEDKGLYFVNPDADQKDSLLKPRQIWTQGETQSNSVWMPTIDRPNERMTSEIFITSEDKYVTLSNGLLFDQKKNSDGTRTDHWRMDLPSAPYLIFFAVGQWTIVKDKLKDGREVSYYVEPQFAQYAKQTFGQTPAMIDFFSKILGVDYPWAKYSQVCARDYVSGAMENTTATLHSDYLQTDDREYLDESYEDYVSHELFHQWFGDYVTCESWSNLPLNESMADYSEYLWEEFDEGKEVADYFHYKSLQGYFRESAAGRRTPEWQGKREPLIRFYYEDREDMFDNHSYNKGGQVLHLLRQYVGDEAFFASLKLYLDTKKFSSGEIADLRMAFEQVTGKDMNWFFNEWFMEPGHPELDITYNYNDVTKRERVIIKQTQDRTDGTPVFRIPMSVDIYSGGKVDRQEILVKSTCDTFYFPYVVKPEFVNVDAQKNLPAFKVDHHTSEEWAFLYSHSTLYIDRVEAINGLVPRKLDIQNSKTAIGNTTVSENGFATETIKKALDDKFWAIRSLACRKIGKNISGELTTKLITLISDDEKSDVRVAAIEALSSNENYDGEQTNRVMKYAFIEALNDKSYRVVGAALIALINHYPAIGLAECEKRENDPARSMKTAVGGAYAYGGSDGQQPWFEKTLPTLFGAHQKEFILDYGALLHSCSRPTIQKALVGLETLYNNSTSPTTLLYTKGTLQQLTNYYKEKAADFQKEIDELKSVKKDATGLQKLQAEKAEADLIAADIDAVVKRLK